MSELALSPLDRYLPPRWRVWGVLAVAMVAITAALFVGMRVRTDLVYAVAGAFAAICPVLIWGTRLTIPAYFATTIGIGIFVPGIPISVNRGAAALMLLSLLLEMPWAKLRVRWSASLVVLSVFTVYYLVAAIILRPEGAAYPFEYLLYILLAAVLLVRGWDQAWLKPVLIGFVIGTFVIVTLPGLFEAITRRDITSNFTLRGRAIRINGLTPNAIFFAYLLCWMMPFTIALLLDTRSWFLRSFYLLNILLTVYLSIITGNRQTPIVLALMLIVFLFFLRSHYRRWLLVAMVVGGVFSAPLVATKVYDRFSTVGDVQKDISLLERRDKMVVAWEMIKDRPWFGIGHDYYRYVAPDYMRASHGKLLLFQFLYTRPRYIDMGYTQILTEYGIVGSFMVLVLILSTGIYFLYIHRLSLELEDPWLTNLAAAAFSTIVFMLVSCLIQDVFVTPRTYFSYALMFAAGTAIHRALPRGEEPSRAEESA